jgi:hypothetical protein
MFTKSRCREIFPKQSTKISMLVIPDFFCFIAFRVFLSDGSSNTQKKRPTKKSCRKVFAKKSTNNPKSISFDFVYHVFGRFSVGGVKKHH